MGLTSELNLVDVGVVLFPSFENGSSTNITDHAKDEGIRSIFRTALPSVVFPIDSVRFSKLLLPAVDHATWPKFGSKFLSKSSFAEDGGLEVAAKSEQNEYGGGQINRVLLKEKGFLKERVRQKLIDEDTAKDSCDVDGEKFFSLNKDKADAKIHAEFFKQECKEWRVRTEIAMEDEVAKLGPGASEQAKAAAQEKVKMEQMEKYLEMKKDIGKGNWGWDEDNEGGGGGESKEESKSFRSQIWDVFFPPKPQEGLLGPENTTSTALQSCGPKFSRGCEDLKSDKEKSLICAEINHEFIEYAKTKTALHPYDSKVGKEEKKKWVDAIEKTEAQIRALKEKRENVEKAHKEAAAGDKDVKNTQIPALKKQVLAKEKVRTAEKRNVDSLREAAQFFRSEIEEKKKDKEATEERKAFPQKKFREVFNKLKEAESNLENLENESIALKTKLRKMQMEVKGRSHRFAEKNAKMKLDEEHKALRLKIQKDDLAKLESEEAMIKRRNPYARFSASNKNAKGKFCIPVNWYEQMLKCKRDIVPRIDLTATSKEVVKYHRFTAAQFKNCAAYNDDGKLENLNSLCVDNHPDWKLEVEAAPGFPKSGEAGGADAGGKVNNPSDGTAAAPPEAGEPKPPKTSQAEISEPAKDGGEASNDGAEPSKDVAETANGDDKPTEQLSEEETKAEQEKVSKINCETLPPEEAQGIRPLNEILKEVQDQDSKETVYEEATEGDAILQEADDALAAEEARIEKT